MWTGCLLVGIYDDRLFIKKVEGNEEFQMEEAGPYPGAKPMWLVGEVDDREKMKEIIKATVRRISLA